MNDLGSVRSFLWLIPAAPGIGAVLNVALGIFVWVQMAMTGASALSIPVTLVRRAVRK